MKPTREQITTALEAAESLRAAGEDADGLGACLIYLHQRNRHLEELLSHVERFINFGMPAEEHARLQRLVDRIRELDRRDVVSASGDDGL